MEIGNAISESDDRLARLLFLPKALYVPGITQAVLQYLGRIEASARPNQPSLIVLGEELRLLPLPFRGQAIANSGEADFSFLHPVFDIINSVDYIIIFENNRSCGL